MYNDLIAKGLIRSKDYTEGQFAGLSVLKYHNKVFFENLFKTDPRLEEARGLVVNHATGEIVMRPFQKVYNYGENSAGKDVSDETKVQVVQKLNGFMAQVTRYQGRILVGTTGTLDSEYAALARKALEEQLAKRPLNYGLGAAIPTGTGWTYLFEICDPSDPHIVPEVSGAYLIGMRDTQSGKMATEHELDKIAGFHGWLRPKHWITTMGNTKALRKMVQHEGFMLRDAVTGVYICKMKSSHYLAKKALMRMGHKRAKSMYEDPNAFKQQIDEEFYTVVDFLLQTYTLEEYKDLGVQERRKIFEDFYSTKEYM